MTVPTLHQIEAFSHDAVDAARRLVRASLGAALHQLDADAQAAEYRRAQRQQRRLGIVGTRRCGGCKRFLGGRVCACGWIEGRGYAA